jgi:hypothetical protein
MLTLYAPYINYLVARLEQFAEQAQDLAADDAGQSETTEMLIRISLALAIIVVVGGLLYLAITHLGQDVSNDIGGVSWGE